MILARVVLGSPALVNDPPAVIDPKTPMRRPPSRTDGRGLYDCVIGESKNWDEKAYLQFREYIVYDRTQCYPEYLIRYKRCK
jgi:hypothetical protein